MFAIVLAALDRSGSVLPILYAMGVHELAHVVMMLACGGRVRRLTLRFADLRIDAAGLGYRQEIFCALAGPGMSVLVCLALRKAYATCAAISLLLGLFNAMPVYPLDGGRALRAGLCLFLPLGRAEAVSNLVSLAVCAAGLAGAISCAKAYWLGAAPLAVWLVVLLRVMFYGHEEGLVSRAPVRYNK